MKTRPLEDQKQQPRSTLMLPKSGVPACPKVGRWVWLYSLASCCWRARQCRWPADTRVGQPGREHGLPGRVIIQKVREQHAENVKTDEQPESPPAQPLRLRRSSVASTCRRKPSSGLFAYLGVPHTAVWQNEISFWRIIRRSSNCLASLVSARSIRFVRARGESLP